MEWEKEASDECNKDDIPLLGPKDDQSREASQFGEEYADGNENAIKSKPAGLGGTPSLPAIKYACVVPVVGRDFLMFFKFRGVSWVMLRDTSEVLASWNKECNRPGGRWRDGRFPYMHLVDNFGRIGTGICSENKNNPFQCLK